MAITFFYILNVLELYNEEETQPYILDMKVKLISTTCPLRIKQVLLLIIFAHNIYSYYIMMKRNSNGCHLKKMSGNITNLLY